MIIFILILVFIGIKSYNRKNLSEIPPPKDPDAWLKKYNDVPKSKPYKAD